MTMATEDCEFEQHTIPGNYMLWWLQIPLFITLYNSQTFDQSI